MLEMFSMNTECGLWIRSSLRLVTCASNVAAIQPPTYQSLLPPSAEGRHARNVAPKMKGVGVTLARGNNKTGARSSSTSLSRAPEGSHSFFPNLSFISPPFFISSSTPLFSLVSPFLSLILFLSVTSFFQRRSIFPFLSFLFFLF